VIPRTRVCHGTRPESGLVDFELYDFEPRNQTWLDSQGSGPIRGLLSTMRGAVSATVIEEGRANTVVSVPVNAVAFGERDSGAAPDAEPDILIQERATFRSTYRRVHSSDHLPPPISAYVGLAPFKTAGRVATGFLLPHRSRARLGMHRCRTWWSRALRGRSARGPRFESSPRLHPGRPRYPWDRTRA
jgi:hypothetical protein